MIIECQTCHARFRLDESRIKGRGARVKCRKCGDSIVVLKDGASSPPAPGGDGFFDLGSAVRDSAGEKSGVPPPVGNLIPFPAPARPGEPEKDDVDLAFDRFLSPGVERSSPRSGKRDATVPVEREVLPPAIGAPPGAGPRRVDPRLRARGKTGPSSRRGCGATVRRTARRRAVRGIPWRGRVPDQRFGYPGFPAGETSRHGVGGSPEDRRHLPGDLVRAGRRGEFLSAGTRRAACRRRETGSPRRRARIRLLRPRRRSSSRGTSPHRRRPSSKSRRTGKRNPPPRPPSSPRCAVDPPRRNPRAHGLPPDPPWR